MEKEYTLFNLSFLVIVGLILIVLSASISFIVATRIGVTKDDLPENPDIVEFTGKTVNLGSFTTDLRDTDRNRIVRVEIALEVEDNKAITQIQERKIQLQDRILSILRSKSLEELKGNEGKAELSNELKRELEKFLSYRIINIYFNEFIVQ